jgi:hypothetical protein
MNLDIQQLYNSTVQKMNNFSEPIRYGNQILTPGAIFTDFNCVEDYQQIVSAIQKTMRPYGVDLEIRTIQTKKICNSTVVACYVAIRCAFSKKISDETKEKHLREESESAAEGQTSQKSRATKTKRISNCECRISLNWRSDTCQWVVGQVMMNTPDIAESQLEATN